MEVKKPLKMYPVVIMGLLIGGFLGVSSNNPMVSSSSTMGVIICCLMIYNYNVKKFGKRYWRKAYS